MKQSVKLGNPESNVAICTLWTPLEIVDRQVSPDAYAIIGQLYSKDAGINTVVRYCLYNKKIRYIIVCGQDRTGSGQALVNLVEKGIDKMRNILGVQNAAIDEEIPFEAVERFRKNVEVIDKRGITDYSSLTTTIKQLPKKESCGEPESFPDAKIELPEKFPTDPVFKIRSKTIGEAWLQALHLIMKFGMLKESQHDEKQKEIICLVTIITEEDAENIDWKPYFSFPQEELDEYFPQVLTDQKIPELAYTYGQRLRSHKGIDQIDEMAKKLKEAPHTRRAIAFTWDVAVDSESKSPPCLNLVQALVQNGKLYMIAYTRSNDIYGAWPKNPYALRKLQQELCRKAGFELGDLIMISASAHIYERHFRMVKELLKDYPLEKNLAFELPRSTGNLDPRGNVTVEVADGKIKLTHLNPEGERLEEFSSANAQDAIRWLVIGQKISDISHALYLGQEISKAEMAIKAGKSYRQDMPL